MLSVIRSCTWLFSLANVTEVISTRSLHEGIMWHHAGGRRAKLQHREFA
ncbi:hypothetical protein K1W54_07350 [Micromonospora sp. CPCC 205371]|nr:hypothetical protein [Micromonospora sp. CPCC 205371]